MKNKCYILLCIVFSCIFLISCLNRSSNTNSKKVELALTDKLSKDLPSIYNLFTQNTSYEKNNFKDYALPNPEYELGTYYSKGKDVYAEAAKIDDLSQGISSQELCIMRFNSDTNKWQTIYEYTDEDIYGRIYNICEYDGRLFWNYIKYDDTIKSNIYEFNLTTKKVLSVKEYSEINQMKIFDNYLVLYEIANNEDKYIHVIDLDINKDFCFTTSDLNITESFVIPSVHDGLITYVSNDEKNDYYILSADISTGEVVERIKVGDPNILYVVRDDNYTAWVSGTSSEYNAYILYNNELYSLYNENSDCRLSLGKENGILILNIYYENQESVRYIDVSNKKYWY